MDQLPYHLYTRDQIRLIEKYAIEQLEIPAYTLMQHAGIAVFAGLREYWTQAKKIIVVCGTGNNGGDGYAVAKLAKQQGLQVTVYYIGQLESLKEPALQAYQDCAAMEIPIKPFSADYLKNVDVIVDGVLGIGLNNKVKSPHKEAIEGINASRLPVLAIDIPSGIDADTGKVLGVAVIADVTTTFIGLKQGLFTGEAPNYCGKILFNDLLIPSSVETIVEPSAERIVYDTQSLLLPPRPRVAHKGYFGHVLVIGGCYGFEGATRIAAEAALRTGAGLVSVATKPDQLVSISSSTRPELMVHRIEYADELTPLLEKATVIAVGPGLGQSAWSQQLFAKALGTTLPLIVDADALNLLANQPLQRDNWILTPHPGEAARLLRCKTEEIQDNRFKAIVELYNKYAGSIVLKGAGTLVYNGETSIKLCSDGNPGMASAGMGDLLTGIIAGLVAQSIPLMDAAQLGVCLHARAGDLARIDGERGMVALDLLSFLRRLVNPL